MAVGQFAEDGVAIHDFRETSDAERDNKVLEFVCGASYHAYCQTLGLIATGALKATQDA